MYQLDLNILTFFLIFYIYCFLGWCFESVYVSVKSGKWVNRGFMKGPFLPIYGSGAVVILFCAIPVMDKPVAVYVVSFVCATALELGTGMAMEKIFKVRYWDYSDNFLNFRGYICLKSSVTWGFMGMFVTYILNEPVAVFIDSLNVWVSAAMVAVLTVIFVTDFVKSFGTAYDLRNIIVSSEKLMAELGDIKMQIADAIEERMESAGEKKEEIIGEIRERINTALSYTEIDDIIINKIEELKKSGLDEYAENWKMKAKAVREKAEALKERRVDILKRNPSAKAKIGKRIREFMKDRG